MGTCAPADLLCGGLSLIAMVYMFGAFCVRASLVFVAAMLLRPLAEPLVRRAGIETQGRRATTALIVGLVAVTALSEFVFSDVRAVGWIVFPRTMVHNTDDVEIINQPAPATAGPAWLGQESRTTHAPH